MYYVYPCQYLCVVWLWWSLFSSLSFSCVFQNFYNEFLIFISGIHKLHSNFSNSLLEKKIQVDMILMWLWDYLYQLTNSSEKGIIIQLDFWSPYELSSVTVVCQNVDIMSLRYVGSKLRGHLVCEKGSRPEVLGYMTLKKAFHSLLSLTFLLSKR